MHNMPGWWQELAEVPKIDDHQELAWKVQASFELPWQISKQHSVQNTIRPHQHCCASARRAFFCSRTISSPGILGVAAGEDGCLCPSPPVLGGRKAICLFRANHAFWQGVYWS